MAGRKGQRSGGHNAKTTAQHEADGTSQKCRHGERADNEPAKGKPERPSDLDDVEQALWDEVVTYLPDGCVGRVDTTALREMCRWFALYRNAMGLFSSDPLDKDARLAATAAWDRFWRIAQDFGATPVARTRLQSGDDSDGKDKPKGPMQEMYELLASRN